MRVRLGIVVTTFFSNIIKDLQLEFKEKCDIVFLPFSSFNDIKDIYINNRMNVDGFMFGGLSPFKILLNEFHSFDKPCYYFNIDEASFYKLLFKLSAENKLFDFSRVFIDFISEGNNYLGLKEILPDNSFPYTLSKFDTTYDKLEEYILEQHLKLWEDGKIDFSITRMSNIADALNRNGVKFLSCFPSMDNIRNAIKNAINDIEFLALKNNQICIANITIEDLRYPLDTINDEFDYKYTLLYESLLKFNNQHVANFVIQRNHMGFEISTSRDTLITVTNNLTRCSLLNYFHETLPFKVRIGWGSGTNLYQSRKNANLANKEAEAHGGDCSFAITENDSIIGPLDGENLLTYSNYQSKEVENLSSNLQLSPLTVQKIIAVINKLNTNEISAEDLATHLGITLRSANRILTKIVNNNGASVVHEKQEKLRGRPKKIYAINFKYF